MLFNVRRLGQRRRGQLVEYCQKITTTSMQWYIVGETTKYSQPKSAFLLHSAQPQYTKTEPSLPVCIPVPGFLLAPLRGLGEGVRPQGILTVPVGLEILPARPTGALLVLVLVSHSADTFSIIEDVGNDRAVLFELQICMI